MTRTQAGIASRHPAAEATPADRRTARDGDETRSVQRRGRTTSRRGAHWQLGLLGLLIFGVALEIITRSSLVDARYFPRFSEVLARVVDLLGSPDFISELAWTLWAWTLVMVMTFVIAIPLGVAIGRSETVYELTLVPIEVLRPLPAVALIPLVILVLGAGTTTKVVLALGSALWPVLFNTAYGTREVDQVSLDTARMFRIPRGATVLRIILPAVLPFILTGVRVAASVALIVLVGTELVAGTINGVGTFILQASYAGDMTSVLAGALVTGLVGVVINAALSRIERWLVAWHIRRTEVGA